MYTHDCGRFCVLRMRIVYVYRTYWSVLGRVGILSRHQNNEKSYTIFNPRRSRRCLMAHMKAYEYTFNIQARNINTVRCEHVIHTPPYISRGKNRYNIRETGYVNELKICESGLIQHKVNRVRFLLNPSPSRSH